MSCEQDMTLSENTGDIGLLKSTVLFQNNETFEDIQCFGFVWQNIPEYLLSWEWSSSPGNFPINYETFPFPIPASEPCNYGQQKHHLLKEETSNSPWSLIQESDPSSAFTEASPYSEAFGLGIHSGFNNSQPSDPVEPPSGPSSSQQPIDTAEVTAQPEEDLPNCTLDDQDGPEIPDVSGASRSEVRRPKTNPPRGRCEKNSKRSQLPSVTTDHQGRRTKLGSDKKGRKGIKREQNRLAAAKCRDRKRDLANALNTEVEELRVRHQQLSLCYNQVRSEVIRLKTEVLRHADCDCYFIRRYISAEANKTVDKLTRHDPFLDGCDIRSTAT
ncbi:Transcription factor atf21 [Fusarium austroafricanum]|uniref:Transcription factor atf21 n=1 Tax=Fusarium austroafricanum TaxID=2364996 RepID=A0A8H4NT72_9HYPO|nr:Transcription factor atf21 [Fusarium austroafricanum]